MAHRCSLTCIQSPVVRQADPMLQEGCAVHGLLFQSNMQSGSSHETGRAGFAGRMCSAWPTRGRTCWPQATTVAASACGTSSPGSGGAHSHTRLLSTRGVSSSCSSCGPPRRKHRPSCCPVEVHTSLYCTYTFIYNAVYMMHIVCYIVYNRPIMYRYICKHPVMAAVLRMLSDYPNMKANMWSCAPHQRFAPLPPALHHVHPHPLSPPPYPYLLTLWSPSTAYCAFSANWQLG